MANVLVTQGHAPASPIPNRNRVTSIDAKLKAAAVAMVNADHQATILANTRRVPPRSAQRAVGISNSA